MVENPREIFISIEWILKLPVPFNVYVLIINFHVLEFFLKYDTWWNIQISEVEHHKACKCSVFRSLINVKYLFSMNISKLHVPFNIHVLIINFHVVKLFWSTTPGKISLCNFSFVVQTLKVIVLTNIHIYVIAWYIWQIVRKYSRNIINCFVAIHL